MRRPYLTYLLAVVVPSAATVAVSVGITGDAWEQLHRGSSVRVARMALAVLEQDIGRAVDSLAGAATPVVMAASPSVDRARSGDTVMAMAPHESGLAIRVMTAPVEGDPEGTVRYAEAPLGSEAARRVGGGTGYAVALYLSGRRWSNTEAAPGPESLDRSVLLSVSELPGGMPLEPGSEEVLVALAPQPGTPPAMVALASPGRQRPSPLPVPLILVMGLLLVFAALAGWIQLTGPTDQTVSPAGRASLVLLTLVPALTAWVFLVHADRLHRQAVHQVTTQELTRALAVASIEGAARSTATVRALTDFHATLVRDGLVEESTFQSPLPAVAALPAPPPSFTASGTVDTPEGPSVYVALRLPGGGHIVVTAPEQIERLWDFRRKAWLVAGVLAAWLALVATAVTLRWRRVSS